MTCDGSEARPAELSIRQASLADRELIFRIHVDAVAGLCGTHYSEEQLDRWFEGRSPADYAGAIECGGDWIAHEDEVPVGFVEFFTRTISMLYVRPERAGRGVGGRLLRFAVNRMRGRTDVIEVEALLNAEAFYRRHGFRSVGESCLRRPSGLVLPTVLMECRP